MSADQTCDLMSIELADLRAAGDQLQSAMSRVGEWINGPDDQWEFMPYEVQMAVHEGLSAVEKWTEARKHSRV